MKAIRFISIAVILIAFCAFTGQVGAQEKSKEEKQKELKMQEEIDAQKKAISEQKKAQEEAEKAFQLQKEELEKAMKEAQENIDVSKYEDLARRYSRVGENFPFNVGESFPNEPYIVSPGIEFYGLSHDGDNEKTVWDFSKSVKEKTFSRDYTFDVEPTSNTVVMSVNGYCKDGEIRIKIIMPNGKVYSDILLDEFGNLNWRKSFTISEEENKDKAGAWKFQINATKATGYFKISLQTY